MLLSRFRIVGHSMEPTFLDGQTVMVSRLPYLFYSPRIGDVVAFWEEKTKKVFVKRISKIDRGLYFVQGDNRHDSKDSRGFGFVEECRILGKVLFSL